MNPQSDAGSPLATLRQLKEMLDAGAITPQEFEALKQRLVFGAPPTGEASPLAPARADEPAPPVPNTPAAPSAPAEPVPPTAYLDTPGALTPEATPLLAPEPDWLAAPAPLPAAATAAHDEESFEPELAAERRNPLNLVFAIGGLLLFLGLMAYLSLGRRTAADEHLTSTSQTAADSVRAAPEVGPQAEQLTLPPAVAPETIRVAPAVPRPVATAPPVDSAAVAAPVVPPVKTPVATPAKTAPAAPAKSPAATPTPAASPTDTTRAGQP